MDWLKKTINRFTSTPAGIVISVIVYAIMIALVLVFFESGGEFIYEGF